MFFADRRDAIGIAQGESGRNSGGPGDVTRVPTTKKPLDVLVDGLYSEQNRGDRTRFELVVEGIRLWTPETRFLLGATP